MILDRRGPLLAKKGRACARPSKEAINEKSESNLSEIRKLYLPVPKSGGLH